MINSIEYFAGTHRGYRRGQNEDSYVAMPENGLWLVADGMGGHPAGEVASEIVVEQVTQAYESGVPIADALMTAHQALLDAPKQGRGREGMGSTAVVLTLRGDSYKITWVGDSRAYCWNGVSLVQLTRDHTYIQGLINSGAISAEEAVHHPLGNILDQAIGSEKGQIYVEQCTREVLKGERLLLCSDGLSSEVPHDEIESIFIKNMDEKTTVENLIKSALAYGGADNITVIVVTI